MIASEKWLPSSRLPGQNLIRSAVLSTRLYPLNLGIDFILVSKETLLVEVTKAVFAIKTQKKRWTHLYVRMQSFSGPYRLVSPASPHFSAKIS